MLKKLLQSCPTEIDLTNIKHLQKVEQIVEAIDLYQPGNTQIDVLENGFAIQNNNAQIFGQIALKIVKSKRIVKAISTPLKVSVVLAMYKENNRIKSKAEHPHGEDFLLRKVDQLKQLFEKNPNISWELILVDDGCPEKSGQIAQDIIQANNLEQNARVLFLKEAIDQQLQIVNGLNSTKDSQKGGSIIYGMWSAIQEEADENQIVIYTDADLSTHLGQVGLLLDPILNDGKSVAIGSRREKDSIVIKQGSRNNRGKLFIYLWKRMIPTIGEIIDTQCGFKAFKKDTLQEILGDLVEMKFAFDIELLLKSELVQKKSISKVGIAWIDSEAASTTTDIQPYLPMLKAIVKMYRKYLPLNEMSDEFAEFIEEMNEEQFQVLLENIPEDITDKEPVEFGEYDGVMVEHLVKAKNLDNQRR